MQISIDLSLTGSRQQGAPSYVAEASTLFTAMSVPPPVGRKQYINNMIVSLKAAGLWTKFGYLYILAAHDEQAGRLNWVLPGTATLTAVNSPTFTVDRGFAGDGSTSYLTTGVNHNALTNYAQDSAHAGGWAVTAGNGGAIVGTLTTARVTAAPGATRSVRVNTGTLTSTTLDPTTGHVVGVRRDSANQFSYRNGGTEVTGAAVSAGLLANNAVIGATGAAFSTVQIGGAHFGTQLSAADVTALYGILRTYMTAIGVP